MTLLRQLILSTLGLLLVVVCGSLVITVHNTRSYLNAQLATHAQDAATSLGLTLTAATEAGDTATQTVMVDAVFDRGYYRSIEVRDAGGGVTLRRQISAVPPAVPGWFTRLLPLATPSAEAVIMGGWQQLGTVNVRSHPGQAYSQLWQSTLANVRLFLAAGLLGILGAWLLVRTILRPLKAVETQAAAIARRDFATRAPLPRTPDLRRVAVAMNELSDKVRQMLAEQLALMEVAQAQAYRDPVTGLGNRIYFDNTLGHLLTAREEPAPGALALVQIRGLAAHNTQHGYGAGDTLLKAAATAVGAALQPYGVLGAARLGGGDFAWVLAESRRLDDIGTALCAALRQLHSSGQASDADVGHVGIASLQARESPRALLSRADRALREAQRASPASYVVSTDTSPALTATDNAERLRSALANRRLVLHAQSVHRLSDGAVLHHEILARIATPEGLVPAGAFLPGSEREGLAQALDRGVLATLFASSSYGDTRPLAVNLSPSSIADAGFRTWLREELARRPALAGRLCLELPEYGAGQHLDALREFAKEMRAMGTGLGLDHFGRGFSPFGYLASLRPAYLKMDGTHSHALPHSEEGAFFVRALANVAHTLDALLIAQNVEHDAQLSALMPLGVDGAQGYRIAPPGPFNP